MKHVDVTLRLTYDDDAGFSAEELASYAEQGMEQALGNGAFVHPEVILDSWSINKEIVSHG